MGQIPVLNPFLLQRREWSCGQITIHAHIEQQGCAASCVRLLPGAPKWTKVERECSGEWQQFLRACTCRRQAFQHALSFQSKSQRAPSGALIIAANLPCRGARPVPRVLPPTNIGFPHKATAVAWQARVASDTRYVHTPTMPLKNAALLALIGTILMTALLVWNFVFTFLNVLRSVVPAAMLFQSFIYAFGCFSVAVFFYVFHRAQ
jgi:hypothetical protein